MLSTAMKWFASSSFIVRRSTFPSVASINHSLTAGLSKSNNGCWQTIVRGMANHRHKKVIKLAKGFRGRANRCYSVAYHRVIKARQYAYRDRKVLQNSPVHDSMRLTDETKYIHRWRSESSARCGSRELMQPVGCTECPTATSSRGCRSVTSGWTGRSCPT